MNFVTSNVPPLIAADTGCQSCIILPPPHPIFFHSTFLLLLLSLQRGELAHERATPLSQVLLVVHDVTGANKILSCYLFSN